MHGQPRQLTVLRSFGHDNHFTVVMTDDREVVYSEALCYDEMLGVIARAFCPTMDDGTPNRQIGRPLFLNPPGKS